MKVTRKKALLLADIVCDTYERHRPRQLTITGDWYFEIDPSQRPWVDAFPFPASGPRHHSRWTPSVGAFSDELVVVIQ